MSKQSNFRFIPTGNQEYSSSICGIVRCMSLLPPLLPWGYSYARKRKHAGWNYLNTDSEFRLFEGYSAFGFIQSQGRKEFLFIGNWRSQTDVLFYLSNSKLTESKESNESNNTLKQTSEDKYDVHQIHLLLGLVVQQD